MLEKLEKSERMLLLKFVCAFAWADLEIRDSERQFVASLVQKLKLSDDESAEVQGWLKMPPKADELDPNRVPREHRQLFINAARDMIAADGEIAPDEQENLDLLKQLLR